MLHTMLHGCLTENYTYTVCIGYLETRMLYGYFLYTPEMYPKTYNVLQTYQRCTEDVSGTKKLKIECNETGS